MNNGFKVKEGWLTLDTRKKFFTIRHQNGLPRDGADALSLEASNVQLDGLVEGVPADCRGAGLDGL